MIKRTYLKHPRKKLTDAAAQLFREDLVQIIFSNNCTRIIYMYFEGHLAVCHHCVCIKLLCLQYNDFNANKILIQHDR